MQAKGAATFHRSTPERLAAGVPLRVLLDSLVAGPVLPSPDSSPAAAAASDSASSVGGVPVTVGDWTTAQPGDACPCGKAARLVASKGIEVGHAFYLGEKYSQPFKAHFTDEQGQQRCVDLRRPRTRKTNKIKEIMK